MPGRSKEPNNVCTTGELVLFLYCFYARTLILNRVGHVATHLIDFRTSNQFLPRVDIHRPSPHVSRPQEEKKHQNAAMLSACARSDPGFAVGRAALVVVFLVEDSNVLGGRRDEHLFRLCS